MLVFVDESGDAGMDVERGASQLFVVTGVMFHSEESAEACRNRIKAIRGELRLPAAAEFKFTKTSNKFREYFLESVAAHDFFYMSAVFDKRRLTGRDLRIKRSFYQYVVGFAFEFMKPHLEAAYLEIDKTGGEDFGRQMTRHIAEVTKYPEGQKRVKRAKLSNSAGNDLVQLADMICGAVSRSHSTGDGRFRSLIQRREMDVHLWP
ncbi:MAG TPA: DUF3800 domain-containing protein [Pirellulales bacterium]|nr:DUF3800 domain-containing protein [Pirellulales bacterium]